MFKAILYHPFFTIQQSVLSIQDCRLNVPEIYVSMKNIVSAQLE